MKLVIKEEDVPKSCGTCQFYQNRDYRCHNEIGTEAHCTMGFMSHKDMRDVDFINNPRFKDQRFSGCRIEEFVIREN